MFGSQLESKWIEMGFRNPDTFGLCLESKNQLNRGVKLILYGYLVEWDLNIGGREGIVFWGIRIFVLPPAMEMGLLSIKWLEWESFIPIPILEPNQTCP